MKKMHLMIVMFMSLLLTFSVSAVYSATPSDAAKATPVVKPAAQAASEVPALPSAEADKVNINTADEAALMKIKGIGKKKAEAIVSFRKEHGNFASVEDLKKIKGFRPQVL